MCRSIKKLRDEESPPTEQDIEEAALQFVRKISGYRVPSKKNEDPFNAAVDEIAEASRKLLEGLKKR